MPDGRGSLRALSWCSERGALRKLASDARKPGLRQIGKAVLYPIAELDIDRRQERACEPEGAAAVLVGAPDNPCRVR